MTLITSDNKILKDKSLNFVDMHHHSTVSDGNNEPKFLEKVFMKRGLGLCIADHNQIKGSVYLAKRKKVFTIPSIEITTKSSNDVLAYFYSVKDLISFWEKEIKKRQRDNAGFNYHNTTFEVNDLLDKIKDYNGLSFLAHPIMPRLIGLFRNPKESISLLNNKETYKKFDGLESHNFLNGRNKNHVELFKKYNKPLIAGSDSHTVSLFNTLTASKKFQVESFLKSILKRKNKIYCKGDNILQRFFDKWAVVKNNISFKASK